MVVKSSEGKAQRLTIDGKIQQQLEAFISKRGQPIAAVVMVDVASGTIIAMAQGKEPEQWSHDPNGASTHTALYSDFPAASLFKTVTTAALLEVGATAADKVRNLTGGCAEVNPQGSWLRDKAGKEGRNFTLEQAFAISCNGFFAQMAVKYLGLNVLSLYASKFGWDGGIATDFFLKQSPHVPPQPNSSSVGSVGKYAAGFGRVGISPMHAAWINLAIARDGVSLPLRVQDGSDKHALLNSAASERRLLSNEHSQQLRTLMHQTVIKGSARGGFRSKKYLKIRELAGGKTGSLTGKSPKGRITWFSGLMPYDKPQVVVSAVVVNSGAWQIRGSQLAAEALWLWYQEHWADNRIVPSMPRVAAQ